MIGSFPGSLFNQIFGASIVNKISLKNYVSILILSLIIILYLLKIQFNIFDIENYFIINSKETIIYFTLLFQLLAT